MSRKIYLFPLLITIASFLFGCATPIPSRVEQFSELESYADTKSSIPPQSSNVMRVYIYRPQAFIGMFGSDIVIIDGKWMGDKSDPVRDNYLLPGSVFVVDIPRESTRIWTYDTGRRKETDRVIALSSENKQIWFLRWAMKPTYGYLEIVDEDEAVLEIQKLLFSGYVKIGSDL